MDNKLLRHDLLHSNENLVTPRCCEDVGAGFVGRSLKNSRPVIFSQNEDFDIAHHSIIQYFKHIISPPPGGGGDFRDSAGFAALRIDMSCVLSHKRKRRKRLLKQIGRNIAGSLPISAETYANISIGTAVSPCATVSRETDPGPRSDDSAKGFAARRKHVQVIADVPDIQKKRLFPKGNVPLDTQPENHGERPVFSTCFID